MKTLGMEREWRRRYASDAGLKRGKMTGQWFRQVVEILATECLAGNACF